MQIYRPAAYGTAARQGNLCFPIPCDQGPEHQHRCPHCLYKFIWSLIRVHARRVEGDTALNKIVLVPAFITHCLNTHLFKKIDHGRYIRKMRYTMQMDIFRGKYCGSHCRQCCIFCAAYFNSPIKLLSSLYNQFIHRERLTAGTAFCQTVVICRGVIYIKCFDERRYCG